MKTDATKWKVGKAIDLIDFENTIKALRQANIDCIELGLYNVQECDFKKVQSITSEYGVELWSCHLPFYPFEVIDLANNNSKIRSKTVEKLSEYIKGCGHIGIKTIVVHPGNEPYDEKEREERIKCSAESLYSLAEIAEKEGTTVAVENLPRTCIGKNSDEMLKLTESHRNLKICFDTNHLFEQSVADFIQKCQDNIITLHVSDYDGRNERHWLPYEGTIDWKNLVDSLENAGYNGPFMYELTQGKGFVRTREFTPKDLYDIYKACVKKTEYVPFGKIDEKYCCETAYYR